MRISGISNFNQNFCGWRKSTREKDKMQIAQIYAEAKDMYGELNYSEKDIINKYRWLDYNTPHHDLFIKKLDPKYNTRELGAIVAIPKDDSAKEVCVYLTEKHSNGRNETLIDGFNRMIYKMDLENEEYASSERISDIYGIEIPIKHKNPRNIMNIEAVEMFLDQF